ncbi:MAG: cyclic nucleotide-binding domain-containing protein [Candidatus Cloacimonetes bacterium]|nr:cyclic nucleotide-binding domain-containing protein [Candidatus Cloacimonadota bacterium]
MFFKKIKTMFRYNKELDVIDYNFYRSIDILQNLTNNELTKINDIFIHKSYKKGETIFKENHPNALMYIIKSGRVRLHVNLPYEEITISDLEAKKHFGEIGIFLESNRISSAYALDNAELIAINKTEFIQFVKNQPGTGIKLLYNLGKAISNDLLHVFSVIKQHETK